ncbi:MAG: HAD family hydrolase [Clostridiales bacterium]|nr:HAD family hydrolase [Clostridiales bacterium]
MDGKYEAILYDLDGTLTDSIPLIMKCFHLAYMEVLGEVPRTDEDLMSYIGKPLINTFADVHDMKTAQRLFDTYLKINEVMLANNELEFFDGVKDSLRRLHEAGVRQGIVTSKRRASLMITIELNDMTGLFEQFTVCEDTKEHKPSGEPLIYTAEKMGITDMSRILYVGDALVDYQCALDCGADFALVDWTKMNKADFEELGMPRMITSLDELL